MKVVLKRNALKVFYYLLYSDEMITESELNAFSEIGHELDPEQFEVYREDLIAECNQVLQQAKGSEDFSDMILEAIDQALVGKTNVIEDGIAPRLLLWDMLVIAYSDDHLDETEKRFLRHLVRVIQVDQSVYLEMMQLIETANAVQKEYEWLQHSDKSYAEIRPLVDEIEKRIQIISESARELICDEVIEPDLEEHSNVLSETSEKISEHLNPALDVIRKRGLEAGEKTRKLVGNTAEFARNTAEKLNESGVTKRAGAIFTGIGSKLKRKNSSKEEDK